MYNTYVISKSKNGLYFTWEIREEEKTCKIYTNKNIQDNNKKNIIIFFLLIILLIIIIIDNNNINTITYTYTLTNN